MPENTTLVMTIASYVMSMNSIIEKLAGWGYIGVFLAAVVGSASIILPVPFLIFVFLAAGELNPVLLALVAGAGSAIGEMTGYGLGYGSAALTEKKKRKWKRTLDRTENLFQKYGGFWIIVLFAATPLPHDVVGIIAGALKYPPKRFLVATFIGKFIISLIVALSGFYSLGWVVGVFGLS
ncbi:MAG: hypothetical protein GXO64_01460 [Candidatus Micrarchaeota archaeon]|nr:hypothetical protein [Candidatus Micrarchaeota archaeon]